MIFVVKDIDKAIVIMKSAVHHLRAVQKILRKEGKHGLPKSRKKRMDIAHECEFAVMECKVLAEALKDIVANGEREKDSRALEHETSARENSAKAEGEEIEAKPIECQCVWPQPDKEDAVRIDAGNAVDMKEA